MLKKYIEQYYTDCGLGQLATETDGDRFSLVVGLENKSSEAVIIDRNDTLKQWIITLIFENEDNKSRRWLLKFLEWNYNENEHLPGFFSYDDFSRAITLKKQLPTEGLTYQKFRSVLQNLLAHASFRREQLLRLDNTTLGDNKINSRHIANGVIQQALSTTPSK